MLHPIVELHLLEGPGYDTPPWSIAEKIRTHDILVSDWKAGALPLRYNHGSFVN